MDFTALTEALPQLNLPMAMQYCCNSPELYTEVLRDYCESGRYDEMERAYSEKRWEDYCRCVHSLKSTSRTIGLDGCRNAPGLPKPRCGRAAWISR